MEKANCVILDIHEVDEEKEIDKKSPSHREVHKKEEDKLSADYKEIQNRMQELALTPSSSSSDINKVKTLAQLFEHGSVRDLRTKSPEPKLEEKSSSAVNLETIALPPLSLQLPSLETSVKRNGSSGSTQKSLFLKTEFPLDYRLVRKKVSHWKKVAQQFQLDEKSRNQKKIFQVIKLSKEAEFDKARQEVSTKKHSEKELERKRQSQLENKELACIMLGLMVEAELPLKFYEMVGQSPRIRSMMRKLLDNGSSKGYVIQLFDDGKDGSQKDNTDEIPETIV